MPFFLVPSIPATTETKEAKAAPEAPAARAKPKAPGKAPAKPLPQLMEEEVIPPLLEILQSQDDLSEIELSFQDNRVGFGIFLYSCFSFVAHRTIFEWL